MNLGNIKIKMQRNLLFKDQNHDFSKYSRNQPLKGFAMIEIILILKSPRIFYRKTQGGYLSYVKTLNVSVHFNFHLLFVSCLCNDRDWQ